MRSRGFYRSLCTLKKVSEFDPGEPTAYLSSVLRQVKRAKRRKASKYLACVWICYVVTFPHSEQIIERQMHLKGASFIYPAGYPCRGMLGLAICSRRHTSLLQLGQRG